MAKAKSKKTKASAKPVKRAAKSATQAAVRAAKSANNSWQQQSAKLYQMPFAQGDVGEATKQAAAAAQSATENMMRMGSDAMQQFWSAAQPGNAKSVAEQAKSKVNDVFGQVPGFNPAAAQEKLASFTRASAEQLSSSASSANRAVGEAMQLSRENAEAVVEVSNVAVALTKEISAELINYCNKSFSQNVELSKQVLACRTLNDMFDLSTRFMKTNLDSFFSESVKLSEMLFQCGTDISEPLNERISELTDRLSKVLAA